MFPVRFKFLIDRQFLRGHFVGLSWLRTGTSDYLLIIILVFIIAYAEVGVHGNDVDLMLV